MYMFLKALTDAFLSGADRNKDGAISFEELRDLVERHPNIAENLAVRYMFMLLMTFVVLRAVTEVKAVVIIFLGRRNLTMKIKICWTINFGNKVMRW